MTVRSVLVALAATVLTIAAPEVARAQSARKETPKPTGSKKVLRLEEMKVEGRIQKPQALFLMPRTNLSSADLERTESALPKVVESAAKAPF